MLWAQSSAEVGKIIAAARRHRGLTQAELARASGVTQAWISQVEKGKDNAQIGKVLRLLSYLGVRLRVGESPWEAQPPPRVQDGGNVLSQVLTSLSRDPSGPTPRKRAAKK
jgi:y4mF family transcriptional regulator